MCNMKQSAMERAGEIPGAPLPQRSAYGATAVMAATQLMVDLAREIDAHGSTMMISQAAAVLDALRTLPVADTTVAADLLRAAHGEIATLTAENKLLAAKVAEGVDRNGDGLTVRDKELMPKRAAFLEFCKPRALDVTECKDAWGNRTFARPYVEAMWYGWFNACAAALQPVAAAQAVPEVLNAWLSKLEDEAINDTGPQLFTKVRTYLQAQGYLAASPSPSAPKDAQGAVPEGELFDEMVEQGYTALCESADEWRGDPDATASSGRESFAVALLVALALASPSPAAQTASQTGEKFKCQYLGSEGFDACIPCIAAGRCDAVDVPGAQPTDTTKDAK